MRKVPSKPKTTTKTKQRPPAAGRTAPRPPMPPMPDVLHDRIATRAYEIYRERTSQGPLDDWLKAEQEVLRHPHAGDPVMPHRGGYTGEEQE